MDELTQYLHLPEKAVAKELGICLTSLKKLCRQHGITRWPYRKLKSLDKKIAKAENGSGTGGEDATALKAKADELKREKMAVAFTYGQKDPSKRDEGDAESVTSSDPGISGVEGQEAKGGKAKKTPVKAKLSVLAHLAVEAAAKAGAAAKGAGSTPTSAGSAKAGGGAWPFAKGSKSGIPTPPEEPIVCAVGQDNDIFAEAVADVMANSSMDDNGDSLTPGWEGAAHRQSTAEVELNGATLTSIVEKGRNGTVKMTIIMPAPPTKAPPPLPQSKASVSDADLKIASALASLSSPRADAATPKGCKSAKKKAGQEIEVKEEEQEEGANVRLDEDEDENSDEQDGDQRGSFGHDLMGSEFFSGLRARQAGDCLDRSSSAHHLDLSVPSSEMDAAQRDDDLSPSSLDSAPVQDENMEEEVVVGEHDAKDLSLPSDSLSLEWDQVPNPPASPLLPSSQTILHRCALYPSPSEASGSTRRWCLGWEEGLAV